jgi:hypothetical protein
MLQNTNCKICQSPSEKIFSKTVLTKYETNYYQCSNCSFMQTDEPHWLSEAYEAAITSLDIGLLSRNIHLREEVSKIVDCCYPEAKSFLDYAGGYGAFTRLMRDAGYNFYNQDDYCENIFAKNFDIDDSAIKKFDIVTGFEVLEHFNHPLENIKTVFDYADTAIFSTELIPFSSPEEIKNWWYLTEETGQHIAFYTTKAMEYIAQLYNRNYYCRNGNIHVFTTKKLSEEQVDYAIKNIQKKRYFFGLIKKKVKFKINRVSLLESDYQNIKKKLNLL